MRSDFYDAINAGFKLKISGNYFGINIKTQFYSDKYFETTTSVLYRFANYIPTKAEFNNTVADLHNTLNKFNTAPEYK